MHSLPVSHAACSEEGVYAIARQTCRPEMQLSSLLECGDACVTNGGAWLVVQRPHICAYGIRAGQVDALLSNCVQGWCGSRQGGGCRANMEDAKG
jgi:hypothetical protein